MAEGKSSFVLYVDQKELWEEISDEQAGKLIKHIFKYVNDEQPDAPDQMTKLLFIPIKNSLKRDLRKYEQKKEVKSNAATLGNLKRWHPDLYEEYLDKKISLEKALIIAKDRKASHSDNSIANIAVNVTDTVSVNDTVTVTDNDIKENKEKVEIKISHVEDFEIEGLDELIIPEEKERKKVPQKKESCDAEVWPTFEDFWDAYDKKVGKPNAKKKWKKVNQDEKLEIMNHIPMYILSKPDKQYRKDPTTFLNNRSWEDELVVPESLKPKVSKFQQSAGVHLSAAERRIREINLQEQRELQEQNQ